MLGGGEGKSISSTVSFRSCTERECCFGAGDCEGPVRPGPVLCVNVPPLFFFFCFFVVGILFQPTCNYELLVCFVGFVFLFFLWAEPRLFF